MKKINIDTIRIDGGTQPREKLDQDLVQEYAELMRDGVKFPPVLTFFDGSEYWLVDGFHRYFATKSNGFVSIEAEVKEGTQRDAQLASFHANSKQLGKPATARDKRNSIERMLKDEEWSKWSNAKIAEWVGVSAMTVGRIKVSLAEDKKKAEVTYVNKHGQEKTMKTENLGRKSKPKKEKPKPVEEEYDPTKDEIKELGFTIQSLETENNRLKDIIAVQSWDATDFEKKDAEMTIAELREQIRILEIENKTIKESRDTYQNQVAELMRINNTLKKKLSKFIES